MYGPSAKRAGQKHEGKNEEYKTNWHCIKKLLLWRHFISSEIMTVRG